MKKKENGKWTCRCAEHVRVAGAMVGAKEEVLAWMKTRFPGLRETDESDVEPWYRNYKGGVRQYEMEWRDPAVSGSQYLYLVEKIGDDGNNREEALRVLARVNELLSKSPFTGPFDEQTVALLDEIRSLGWEGYAAKFHGEGAERRWQYGIVDPDSEKAIESSPLAACIGDFAKAQLRSNWARLSGTDWSYLLQYQPRFADKCDWSKLDGYDWVQLLLRQPQFADRCNWSALDGGEWSRLLAEQPQFADRCDWDKLDADAWHRLVCQRPEFAEKCDMGKFTGANIVRLFRERGRRPATGLSRRVDECDLSTLSASNWCGILALRPDLAGKFEAAAQIWSSDGDRKDATDDADAPSPEDEEAALCEDEAVSVDEFFRDA